MSTKIWTAWRLPSRKLNDFLDIVRPQMYAHALKDIERLMAIAEQEGGAQRFSKTYDDGTSLREGVTPGEVERSIRCEMVLDLLKRLDEKEYDGLSVNCGLNVWFYRQRWYVIPWGVPSFYEDLTLPDWVEEYHYQNSTDRPEHISTSAWERRASNWDAAALRCWDAHRLVFYVVDLSRNGTTGGKILRHFMRQPAPPASTARRADAGDGS